MGTKARGGITLYNVKNGKDAEYHRLRPQSEKAVVGVDNSLYITLSYIIEHVNGAQVTTEAGSAQGYHVTARMNNGVSIAMTNGAVNSGTYKLTDYSKAQNRPDYVIIELRDSADKVVDVRTAQIIMEASSYVDIVADLRTTVSQHGDSISTIKQTANSVSATITSLKNGLETVGMHLDGESSTFDVVADRFKVRTTTGNVPFFTDGEKLNASFIDAKKIVTKGLQAGDIDANNATIKNLVVEGDSTFNGTIKTEDGTIAGWKIKHGSIGYGADFDGLSLFDTCLIYNYRNRKRQVIVGEDPKTKISYGADTMLALRNNTRESARNIGVFIDVAPDKDFVFRDNFAILALRGTYAGFRRKLEVVSDDYTIKKEDSSILFTGRVKKLFTLPSDPEDGEEFTIYSAYGQDIDLTTNDGTSIEGDATAPRIRENGRLSALRCTYRIVFSMVRKTWFIFVQ